MPTTEPIQAAAAGATGGTYRKILTYTAKAIGTYVVNNTNFAGVGAYLPCLILIEVDATGGATGTIEVSTDNGTTWKILVSTVASAGLMVLCDTASTIRVTIAAATADVRLFVV